MHPTRAIEIAVGLFVALGAVALFMLAMQVSNLSTYSNDEGYTVVAKFSNIGTLKVRSPVSMAGVTIGRVKSIGFDQDTFQAVVVINVESRYDQIPLDTTASIFTSGLLGEQYIGLDPGGEEESLEDGDEIEITQSALVLEQLIGQFLFNKAGEGKH